MARPSTEKKFYRMLHRPEDEVGVGLNRVNVWLVSTIACIAAFNVPLAARAAPPQTPSSSASPQHQIAARLVLEAQRLLADAIPEERNSAEAKLIEATRLCRSCPEAYAALSRIWLTDYTLGRAGISSLQKAATMAEIVKELSPESPAGEYLGVEVLLTIGRHSEAFKLYSGTKSAYPEHVETDAFEARLWSEVDPVRSLKAAQTALSKGFPLQELSAWIGNAIFKSVGDEASGDALSKFAEVYPDRWLWHRAAMAYVEEKSLTKARHAFEKAIQLGNQLESELQLAIIEYQDLKMHESAVARLERLNTRVRSSNTLGPESLALVETHLAFAHLEANSMEKAQAHADAAINLSVNNEARVNQIIDTFKSENKLSFIAPQLVKLVLSNPLLEEAHLALAIVATQSKNYGATVDHLSAAIALAPERDDLYSARGQALYLNTQYETALEDFEYAIKQKPDYAPYHYNKACLLSLLGRKSEAYESLKTALIINHELRVQAVDDTDLDNLRFDQEYETRLAQLGIGSRMLNRKKTNPQSPTVPEAKRRDVVSPVQVRTEALDE